jgi:flagellar biosynthesis protein FlhF
VNVQKFIGATSREALQLVRLALGPDALILSNRQVPNAGGVEIVAMSAKEMGNLAQVGASRSGPAAARTAEPADSKAQRVEAFQPPRVETDKGRGTQRRDEPVRAHAELHQDGAAVMAELKAMRGMIETQLATIAWSESVRRSPLRMKFTRMLLAAGFGPALARSALARLPDDYTEEQAGKWLASVIARNIPVTMPEANLVSQGGVYAIVGPTGVGKTTTTAKLAARCVVRFGADKIALVTTDSYRIGAQDQLRTYGRILGVPVHVVQDESGLASTIAALRGKHLILIDTVGMGQRDSRVIEQVSMLAGSGANRILVLNATAHPETLEDVVHAFQGKGLAGCIVSKSDEAVCMGGVLDTVLRHRLPLHFVANGQRVPEDLYEPNAQHLVQQALKAVVPKQPFRLSDDEYSLLMAPGEVPATEAKGATHA